MTSTTTDAEIEAAIKAVGVIPVYNPQIISIFQATISTELGRELIEQIVRATLIAAAQARPASEGDMRAFGASYVACYKWPEDTSEHKALRAAYCEGASDLAPDTQGRANDGWQLVPKNITPEIACALEDCAPPEDWAEDPHGAMERLVEDYRPVWERVLAAAPSPPASNLAGPSNEYD